MWLMSVVLVLLVNYAVLKQTCVGCLWTILGEYAVAATADARYNHDGSRREALE